jgi:hypothetical protein
MGSNAEMLAELRRMLKDVFTLRQEGSTYPRLARAHGYVDGYMRALLEGGHATKEELLRLVAEERGAAAGPATREVRFGDAEVAA